MALLDKTQNLDTYTSTIKSIAGKSEIYPYVTGSIGQSVIKGCQDASDLFYKKQLLGGSPKEPLLYSELTRLAFSMNINTIDEKVEKEIKWKTYFVLCTWLTSPTAPTFLGCMLDAKNFVKRIETLYGNDKDRPVVISELETYENLGNLLNFKVCKSYNKITDTTNDRVNEAILKIINNPNKKYALPTLSKQYPHSTLTEKAKIYWPYDLYNEIGKSDCDHNKYAEDFIYQIIPRTNPIPQQPKR